MGKLVRDGIPDTIQADGRHPQTRTLETEEYEQALHAKLREEADELQTARGDAILDEAADVLEVLCAVAELHGYTLDDVIQAADKKAQVRGGFRARVWLE